MGDPVVGVLVRWWEVLNERDRHTYKRCACVLSASQAVIGCQCSTAKLWLAKFRVGRFYKRWKKRKQNNYWYDQKQQTLIIPWYEKIILKMFQRIFGVCFHKVTHICNIYNLNPPLLAEIKESRNVDFIMILD